MPIPHDLQRLPTVVDRVLLRWLAGGDPEQLLLAVGVVVAIVRQPEIALARPAPVAEQHRQRAVAGPKWHSRCVPVAVHGRAHELAVVAFDLVGIGVGLEVVAERQRRQAVRSLPHRAECGRPGVTGIEPELVVDLLEPAVAEPAQHGVGAAPQHHQVGVSIAVDVDRVGAGHGRQIGDRRSLLCESERATDRTLVAVQRGRLAAAGEVQVGATVVVAIEHRHTPAHEELELAVVDVLDARFGRVVHVARWRRRAVGCERAVRITAFPQHERSDDDQRQGGDHPDGPSST